MKETGVRQASDVRKGVDALAGVRYLVEVGGDERHDRGGGRVWMYPRVIWRFAEREREDEAGTTNVHMIGVASGEVVKFECGNGV